MTAPDFRTLSEDALACIVASYGDTPAAEVAQSIRMRCAIAVNAHSIGLMCGHDECFPMALGAVFHATIILAEQAGFDLLADVQDAVNAIRVLQETRRLIDNVSQSPDDAAPPAAGVGERTGTVPPSGTGGDLPGANPGESSTGTVPPDSAGVDDLTLPHGTPRPIDEVVRLSDELGLYDEQDPNDPATWPAPGNRGRISRDGRVFVPVIGEPEFNVIPFPTPAVVPSPLDQVVQAVTKFVCRVWARYRKT